MTTETKTKTWKREMAALMLGHIFLLTYWGSVEALEILAFPYILFMMGAFGLDAVLKQGNFNFSRNK